MQLKHSAEVAAEAVEGSPGVSVRWLWSGPDEAPAFALRLFELEPGAATPYHSHAHEHEIFILHGTGRLRGASSDHALAAEDAVLVLPFEEHQLVNSGTDPLRFLCGIPLPREPLELTAQVSLYPLGQPDLAPAIDRALEIFQQHGLEVTAGPMSTMLSGDSAAVFEALEFTFRQSAFGGDVVMVTTFSNACPVAKVPMARDVSFHTIGRVENQITEPTDPDTIRSTTSRIVLESEFGRGLEGLQPGDRVLVLFAFHRSEGFELLQHPRGDESRPMRGVFALRSPHRPSPIGITEVELVEVEGNALTVRGLDAIDGSPVIDLKPA